MIGRQLLHYEITEKLGEGGMGEVYRARDTRLGRDVAVKVLSRDAHLDPERRARFRREAAAVAALKHPNIITIYSVEEDGDTLFLTMELVEGKALNRLIAPSGMNFMQLLDIAIPVSDAVSHAHAKGITHRDLKPANIMIDEAGRPKVLDFGLAKLMAAETTAEGPTVIADQGATREGVVLGTTSYMSPEQAEGKPTDARSDIFSLGIILYEMSTGQKPFRGDTPISTISSILKDHPPPVTELNRSLPNHMGRVVNRCLAKDPSRRYQVGLDLRNELEGLREESSGVARTSPVSSASWADTEAAAPPPTGSIAAPPGSVAGWTPAGTGGPSPSSASSVAPPAKRSPMLLVAGIAAALVLAAALWQPWKAKSTSGGAATSTPSAAPARPMAVIFPFENLGPAEDAYFAAGITDEITARLAGVSSMGVISRTSATQYDRTGKTMKQIKADLGVDYVLEGTVRWAKSADGKGRVRITPQLIRAADDTHVWSTTFDREIDDIFQVQSDIAGSVVQEIGVSLPGGEQTRLAERPTENLEAYQAYLKAVELTAPGPLSLEEEKAALLERAVQLDPKFIKAWMELTRHHANQYRFLDRTEGRLARAREALKGAEAVDPNHPVTRVARGYYYYYGFSDYDRALVEFTAAAAALPNDADVQSTIGWILRRQGKFAECVEVLERALRLDPRNITNLANTASTYAALRRPDRSLELYDRVIALAPTIDDYRSDAYEVAVSFTGDPVAARRYLLPEPGDSPFAFYFAWFSAYSNERNWAKALEVIESMDASKPLTRLTRAFFRGMALKELGDAAGSRASLEEGVSICRDFLSQSPGNSFMRQVLGSAFAMLGRHEEAIQESKLAVELTSRDLYEGPADLENLAYVYGMAGRDDEAFDLIERLLTMNYANPLTVHDLRLNSRWDPLREEPRFKEILTKHEKAL